MNNVIINRGQGGLGRQPVGQDFISGFVSWLPSGDMTDIGWTSGVIKKFGGVSDAIAAGLNANHIGETPAIITYTITHLGSTGDNIQVAFTDFFGNVTILCDYVQLSTDTTDAILAASLTAAINANTGLSGFNATNSTTTVVITVKAGQGIYPNNGTPLIATVTNDGSSLFAYTQAVTTNGVGSPVDAIFYHITRFFTQSPNATLYVGLWTTPGSWTAYAFPEVGLIQSQNSGNIRQCGVYIPTTFATAQITAIQAQIATLIANNSPMSVLVGANVAASAAASLGDLSILGSEHVSVIIGQDGAAQGAQLFQSLGKSITQLGDVLGLVSRAQVSDDIAWVATYTLSPDGIENAIPAFATTVGGSGLVPQLLSTLSSGTISAIDTYRFIFGRQFVNDSPNGTFVNDSHCATAYTSDYAYIENNRTFDKASRQLTAAYIQQLNAPLQVNADGTLTNAAVAFFEGLGEQALSNMSQSNPNTGRPELSGFTVTINPAQNVLSSSNLVVSVLLQPVGVARNIIINLQFAVSIA